MYNARMPIYWHTMRSTIVSGTRKVFFKTQAHSLMIGRPMQKTIALPENILVSMVPKKGKLDKENYFIA